MNYSARHFSEPPSYQSRTYVGRVPKAYFFDIEYLYQIVPRPRTISFFAYRGTIRSVSRTEMISALPISSYLIVSFSILRPAPLMRPLDGT